MAQVKCIWKVKVLNANPRGENPTVFNNQSKAVIDGAASACGAYCPSTAASHVTYSHLSRRQSTKEILQ